MLLLVGCTQPAPPAEEGRREASVPAVPPLIRRVPSQVVRTSWTFNSSDEECTAVAAAVGTSLVVAVHRDMPIRLVVSLASPVHGPASVPLRFTGPAGAWQIAARQTAARQIAVALGSDETALSRVLVLLSGGVLEVGAPAQPMASLAISPSAAQGQTWFDCARGKML
ncbi:MAG TPA: hypothetical protein VKI44_39320 [Acetobacteraceae bacterium]|nr:hypothetical protein [Acetobacteraceae bacterium]